MPKKQGVKKERTITLTQSNAVDILRALHLGSRSARVLGQMLAASESAAPGMLVAVRAAHHSITIATTLLEVEVENP